jgi:hypothetical protein
MAKSTRWILGLLVGVVGGVGLAWAVGTQVAEPPSDPVPDDPDVTVARDALQAASGQPTRAPTGAASTSRWLARLHAGERVDSRDPRVLRFRTLLRTTALQVTQTEREIAELTVRAWRALDAADRAETDLLALMEAANRRAYAHTAPDQDYAQLLARLTGERGKR